MVIVHNIDSIPRKWTPEELARLKELYFFKRGREIAEILGRTEGAVRKKARFLNITKRCVTHRPWLEEEIEILRNSWKSIPKKEICNKLSRHTWFAIKARATTLRLHRAIDGIWPAHLINLSDAEKGYVAGFLDGEGSIYIDQTKHHYLRITFYNTSEKVIEYLKKLFPFGYIKKYHSKNSHMPAQYRFNRKLLYHFEISRLMDVYTILKAILPYLIIKKEKAIEVVSYVEHKMLRKLY